jgi:hypothetical protein
MKMQLVQYTVVTCRAHVQSDILLVLGRSRPTTARLDAGMFRYLPVISCGYTVQTRSFQLLQAHR